MNKENHTLKVLVAVFLTVLVLGAGFFGWVYYYNSQTKKTNVNTVPKPIQEDALYLEGNAIQEEIKKSDDLDISTLDDTTELDKVDLSGL